MEARLHAVLACGPLHAPADTCSPHSSPLLPPCCHAICPPPNSFAASPAVVLAKKVQQYKAAVIGAGEQYPG